MLTGEELEQLLEYEERHKWDSDPVPFTDPDIPEDELIPFTDPPEEGYDAT